MSEALDILEQARVMLAEAESKVKSYEICATPYSSLLASPHPHVTHPAIGTVYKSDKNSALAWYLTQPSAKKFVIHVYSLASCSSSVA